MPRELRLEYAGASYKWFDVDEMLKVHGHNLTESLTEDIIEYFQVPIQHQVLCDNEGPITTSLDLRRLLQGQSPHLWLFDGRQMGPGLRLQCEQKMERMASELQTAKSRLAEPTVSWASSMGRAPPPPVRQPPGCSSPPRGGASSLLPWAAAWQAGSKRPQTPPQPEPIGQRPYHTSAGAAPLLITPMISVEPPSQPPRTFAGSPIPTTAATQLTRWVPAVSSSAAPSVAPNFAQGATPRRSSPPIMVRNNAAGGGLPQSGGVPLPSPALAVAPGAPPSASQQSPPPVVQPQSLRPSRPRRTAEVVLAKADPHTDVFGFSHAAELDEDSFGCLRITEVSDLGLLARWNRLCPDKALLPGDRILAVNGVTGDASRMRGLLGGPTVRLLGEQFRGSTPPPTEQAAPPAAMAGSVRFREADPDPNGVRRAQLEGRLQQAKANIAMGHLTNGDSQVPSRARHVELLSELQERERRVLELDQQLQVWKGALPQVASANVISNGRDQARPPPAADPSEDLHNQVRLARHAATALEAACAKVAAQATSRLRGSDPFAPSKFKAEIAATVDNEEALLQSMKAILGCQGGQAPAAPALANGRATPEIGTRSPQGASTPLLAAPVRLVSPPVTEQTVQNQAQPYATEPALSLCSIATRRTEVSLPSHAKPPTAFEELRQAHEELQQVSQEKERSAEQWQLQLAQKAELLQRQQQEVAEWKEWAQQCALEAAESTAQEMTAKAQLRQMELERTVNEKESELEILKEWRQYQKEVAESEAAKARELHEISSRFQVFEMAEETRRHALSAEVAEAHQALKGGISELKEQLQASSRLVAEKDEAVAESHRLMAVKEELAQALQQQDQLLESLAVQSGAAQAEERDALRAELREKQAEAEAHAEQHRRIEALVSELKQQLEAARQNAAMQERLQQPQASAHNQQELAKIKQLEQDLAQLRLKDSRQSDEISEFRARCQGQDRRIAELEGKLEAQPRSTTPIPAQAPVSSGGAAGTAAAPAAYRATGDDELDSLLAAQLQDLGPGVLKGHSLVRTGASKYKLGDTRVFMKLNGQKEVTVRDAANYISLAAWVKGLPPASSAKGAGEEDLFGAMDAASPWAQH